MTDLIVVGVLLFFFVSGWRQGVIRILIGPLSLVIAGVTAEIYFLKTQNMALCLGILLFGPPVAALVLSSLLKIWNKSADGGMPPFLLSRVLGGTLHLAWGTFFVVLALILLTVLPLSSPKFLAIKDSINRSKIYFALRHVLQDRVPFAHSAISATEDVINLSQSPEKIQGLQSLPEYEAVRHNEKMQTLLTDPETVEQIKKKDYVKILTNPKVVHALQDKELLQQLEKLSEAIAKQHTETNQPPPQE